MTRTLRRWMIASVWAALVLGLTCWLLSSHEFSLWEWVSLACVISFLAAGGIISIIAHLMAPDQKSSGLTIQEAIRSGKPFKRARWDTYWSKSGRNFSDRQFTDDQGVHWFLHPDDVVAEDWEIRL